jgi:malate permease and related proteins
MVFVNILLPVFLITASGFFVARLTTIKSSGIVKVVFYVLSPCLIFHSLYSQQVSEQAIIKLIVFVVLLHSILFVIGFGLFRLLHWDNDSRIAGTLALFLNNSGNYGLPVLLFAFGEAGFQFGVLYVVVHAAMQVVIGVAIASWKEGMKIGKLLLKIVSVPWLYALIIALALRATGTTLPDSIIAPIEMLAQAAIPVMLMLLGIQLAELKIKAVLPRASLVSALKLALPPFLAWGLTYVLGIDGLLRSVLIIEGSTSAAVNALLLSLQYNRRPDLTASILFITTVGSLVTMTVLLTLLS